MPLDNTNNMYPTITKIQVVAPAGLRSGGPESLHNLVFQLQILGVHSEIVYFPYKQQIKVTPGYEKYTSSSHDIDDSQSTLIIIPETLCMLGFSFKNATTAIWWLSVDHFSQKKYHSYRDYLRYLRLAIRRHRPFGGLNSLDKFLHFSKSHYDEEFLTNSSIKFKRLSGPISSDYINKIDNSQSRMDVILFNPKKGIEVIHRLKASFPEYQFNSLENMNTQELINAYATAKIYVDFGNHPGKERMPREAVTMGCCVITGMLGSANNSFDIPIPAEYKINPSREDFLSAFQLRVGKIFTNYKLARLDFEKFKNEVLNEQKQQVDELLIILKILGIKHNNL